MSPDRRVLLHFTATWAEATCKPNTAPALEAAQLLGMDFREVDVDDQPELAISHGLLNIPAVAVNGRLDLPPIIGAMPAQELRERIDSRWSIG